MAEADDWVVPGGKTPAPTAAPTQADDWIAPQPKTSVAGALWQGLLRGGQSTIQGVGQLGRAIPDPLKFLQSQRAAAGQQRVQVGLDKEIGASEKAYQNAPTTLQHPIASTIGRIGGEMAATAPLAVLGGAAAPASLAGRLATAAGVGAAAGATQPVMPGQSFGTEKLKQAGLGAAGGVAGGALGEVVGSTLGRAIAGNTPQAVDAALARTFRQVVKPSRIGRSTAPQLEAQDRQILTAVDSVIAERPNLHLTDESGAVRQGVLPRSLRQFTEALDQTKLSIFRSYDQMARQAGQQGAMVDLAPAEQELRRVAQLPEVVDFHPNLAADATRLADNLAARRTYSAEEAQGVIQNLNKTISGFYRNPTNESVTHASLLAPVAKLLREGLDQAIEKFQGPGYQALRLRYGALRNVEKDVAGAMQRQANKMPDGIRGAFADFAASEEAIRGILTLNPAALGRAATIKAAQMFMRHINSPNRAIERLFTRRLAQPSGAARQAIGGALSSPYPGMGFSIAGGTQAPKIGGIGPQGGTITGVQPSP